MKRGLILSIAAILLLCLGTGLVLILRPADRPAIPAYSDLVASHRPSDITLRDRNGSVIHELRVDLQGRSFGWVPLKDISPALIDAVICSEDRRFTSHRGVDWRAVASAVLTYVRQSGRRGASTLTMQLAKIIDPDLKGLTKERSWEGKLLQMKSAQAIEKRWSKDQILEAYLNLVSFRGELQGIRAASKGLFQKEPSGLSQIESLVLAALIRSPNAAIPALTQRVARLAGALAWESPPSDLTRVLSDSLGQPYRIPAQVSLAPHVARLLARPGKIAFECTLDGDLQAFASTVLRAYLGELKEKNVRDGAVLVADNRTGQILAYVGNGGIYSSAPFVDGAAARRQAGSTLKPFLYALAFDLKLLTAGSLISDSPIDLFTERGIYRPDNYDNRYRGPVPARIALASSLNIPAVRTILATGEDRFVETLRLLGFSNLYDSDHYGYSLALGSIDVSLYELVQAYLVLARNGLSIPLSIEAGGGKPAEKRVFSKEASFIVSDILSDRGARSTTFGLENPLSTPFWTSVKTGTSKDMRDNWCIGFSRLYTVGVWVGNFSGSPMWNVSGVSGAAPLWHDIMRYLHRSLPSGPPPPPSGIERLQLVQQNGPPVRNEWFIRGTEPRVLGETEKSLVVPSIVYPTGGTTIALDPDIPEKAQKMVFEASPDEGQVMWTLNGRPLGQGSVQPWIPEAGRHSLRLVDGEGTVLDEVVFTVRK